MYHANKLSFPSTTADSSQRALRSQNFAVLITKGGVEMFMCTHLSSRSLPGSLAETDGKRNTGHQFHPLVCSLICCKWAYGRIAVSCMVFPNNLSLCFEIWFILKSSQCYYVIFSNTQHAEQFYGFPFKDGSFVLKANDCKELGARAWLSSGWSRSQRTLLSKVEGHMATRQTCSRLEEPP